MVISFPIDRIVRILKKAILCFFLTLITGMLLPFLEPDEFDQQTIVKGSPQHLLQEIFFPEESNTLKPYEEEINIENSVTQITKFDQIILIERLKNSRRLLRIKSYELGEYDPDTLTSLEYVTDILYQLRRYKNALENNKKLFCKRVYLFGTGHRDTLKTAHTIAKILVRLKQNETCKFFLFKVEKANMKRQYDNVYERIVETFKVAYEWSYDIFENPEDGIRTVFQITFQKNFQSDLLIKEQRLKECFQEYDFQLST